MKRDRLAVLMALVGAAHGCRLGGSATTTAGEPRAAGQADAGASLRLGAPMGQSPRVSLASIAEETARYADKTVITEGRVTAVCQMAGCWMELEDASGEAHVRMTGHSFFVPKTASGRRAIVEAKVLPRPDDGECEGEAQAATGRKVKVELDARAVELL